MPTAANRRPIFAASRIAQGKNAARKRASDAETKLSNGSYDAVKPTKRRKAPSPALYSEDRQLHGTERRKLIAASRDIQRNFSIAAWAIRKHLDFVSTFNFQSRTGNREFDRLLEQMVRDWGQAQTCDVAGRHPLRRMIRLAEARRMVDGDCAFLLTDDGRLQPIEGDRIRTPSDAISLTETPPHIVEGVRLGQNGQAEAFAIHTRRHGGFVFERWVSAENIVFHAWYDRFDQVRGVSPLAAGLNPLRDSYENIEYALAKAKVSQLFGLFFYREGQQPIGPIAEDDSSEPRYSVSFDAPMLVDLEPGDRAEFLETKTPAPDFQQFMDKVIGIALKALDIPLSFYDEAWTNFYGSRAALLLYLKSAQHKREDVREMYSRILRWKIRTWILRGELTLPDGYTADTLPFELIAAGMPWWKPQEEISADLDAIGAALRTRTEVRLERYGDDWVDVVERLREEKAILEAAGIQPETRPGSAPPVDRSVDSNG